MRHILLLCGLLNTTSRSILPKAVAKSNIELLLKEISRCCNSMMACDYLYCSWNYLGSHENDKTHCYSAYHVHIDNCLQA